MTEIILLICVLALLFWRIGSLRRNKMPKLSEPPAIDQWEERHRKVRDTSAAEWKAHIPSKRTSDPPHPSIRPVSETLKGPCHVIDGDTIVISGTKIRIAGIDAPELDHPWGQKSKYALLAMCKGKVVTAHISEEQSYDRIVARCLLPDGTDLAAELVKQGLALDWPKFSGGEYTHLEPPGIRKKLWRAAAKQKGRLKMQEK